MAKKKSKYGNLFSMKREREREEEMRGDFFSYSYIFSTDTQEYFIIQTTQTNQTIRVSSSLRFKRIRCHFNEFNVG